MAQAPLPKVIAALRKHGGMISPASAELDITRQALHKRVNNSPRLQALIAEIKEELLDKAESVVSTLITEKDPATTRWYLTQQGKSRGYGKLTVDDEQLAAILVALPDGALKGLADD